MSAPSHNKARVATYLSGALLVIFVAAAAGWVIVRDYRATIHNAQQHLENFAVVLAQQTALALATLPNKTLPGTPNRAAEAQEVIQKHIAGFYAALELSYSGRLMLFDTSGTLLAVFPRGAGVLGRSYRDHPLFSNAQTHLDDGAFKAAGILDPTERLIAYRRLRNHPMLVVISTPTDEVLERWRADAIVAALGALLVASLVGAATYLLARQLRMTEHLSRDLAENEARLNSIIGSAMDAVISVDESQHIVLFNAAAERIFGCTARQALGSPLEWLIPERFRGSHARHVQRFGEADVTMRRMGSQVVLAGVRTNGEEFPVDASISHVTVGPRKFYTVILRDITNQQRAATELAKSHQDLRELYESMHDVREAERTRVARELHDELAQWLTALKMDLVWAAGRKPHEHGEVVAKLETMKSLVDNTVSAVRRIAADLRPVMLDDLGLIAALESLTSDVTGRSGIAARFNSSVEDIELRESVATAIYRMVQEALTNVARHASASAVEIDIGISDNTLHLRVRDDGIGLRPDPNRKSFGLLGIRERARTLGGDARIYSPAAGGTVVEIDIPLEAHPQGVLA